MNQDLELTIDSRSNAHSKWPLRNIAPSTLLTFSKFNDTILKLVLLILTSSLLLCMQFLLKGFDDNRLLSWQWIMHQEIFFKVLYFNFFLHIAAYLLY